MPLVSETNFRAKFIHFMLNRLWWNLQSPIISCSTRNRCEANRIVPPEFVS